MEKKNFLIPFEWKLAKKVLASKFEDRGYVINWFNHQDTDNFFDVIKKGWKGRNSEIYEVVFNYDINGKTMIIIRDVKGYKFRKGFHGKEIPELFEDVFDWFDDMTKEKCR